MEERFETFEIDDAFDPFEAIEDSEDESSECDYQMPDEASKVESGEGQLSAPERIARLIKRMPGQKARLLETVSFCSEPRSLDEVTEHLAEAFPSDVSVYGADRLVALLEEAGALSGERDEAVSDESVDIARDRGLNEAGPFDDGRDGEGDYLTVERALPLVYVATEAGRRAADGAERVQEVLDVANSEGGRYRAIYGRIVEMTSVEGGCSVRAINEAVDTDPLCAEPRRFATYFLHRLEQAGGVVWDGTWKATEFGKRAFIEEER